VTDADAKLDARMMSRALRLAARGKPSPSPRAAAVVARDGKLISSAFHTHSAGAGAERVALARAGARARGATLYLTLEVGAESQQTPKLSEAIVAAGIRRVVIGHVDKTSRARSGLSKLTRRGIEVVRGVEARRAQRLVADYEKFVRTGLPQVTLKAAVTLDGRSAARSGESKWITGPAARREVHRMRAAADAVMVGIGTVLADDPELTVRAVPGKNPLRVVLDSQLRTPLSAKLVTSARQQATLLLHLESASARRQQQLRAAGVELAVVKAAGKGRGIDLVSALVELARRQVVSLLVEGGARVHGALLDAELVDRVAVFIAPCLLGDAHGLPLAAGQKPRTLADAFRLVEPELLSLGDDVLVRGALASAGRPLQRGRAGRPTNGPGPRQRAIL
jgi:diaminohydroxyphosphoribosylaminopyrimidine deaminase/5-amino-6-(5-phosphoribosylamino)uracil reductase